STQEFVIGERRLRLALWDIEGQAGDRPFFYYGAQAALLVYDVTEPRTLEALIGWVERIRRHAPPDTPLVVAGNKADLPPAVPRLSPPAGSSGLVPPTAWISAPISAPTAAPATMPIAAPRSARTLAARSSGVRASPADSGMA